MYRVVIVEDDPMVSLLNRTFVERDARFQVVQSFQDGRAALAWLEQNPADLAVLDVYMPLFTGLELLHASGARGWSWEPTYCRSRFPLVELWRIISNSMFIPLCLFYFSLIASPQEIRYTASALSASWQQRRPTASRRCRSSAWMGTRPQPTSLQITARSPISSSRSGRGSSAWRS